MKRHIFTFLLLFVIAACTDKREDKVVAPWGEIVVGDSVVAADEHFDLQQVQRSGELIVLTLTGPDSYYEYHGRGMGVQFLLAERFAQSVGVGLRVQLCRDTAEMVTRLLRGEADLIAFPLPRSVASDSLVLCGAAVGQRRWAVRAGSDSLSGALRRWWRPSLLADVEREQRFLLSSRSVTRRVFSPMLSREKGIISSYDHLFKTYAPSVRWDWRLMAAQCYQESTFDPQARSWAGARGLMQLMPATAAQMGLSMADIHDPARNVAAATQYIGLLNTEFRDIPNRNERLRFVLAAYNGGYHHIRDAMALTQKHGGNPQVWEDVAPYVLRLSQPEFYRDEVVRNGYMRGSETCDYVERIIARWNGYRKTAR